MSTNVYSLSVIYVQSKEREEMSFKKRIDGIESGSGDLRTGQKLFTIGIWWMAEEQRGIRASLLAVLIKSFATCSDAPQPVSQNQRSFRLSRFGQCLTKLGKVKPKKREERRAELKGEVLKSILVCTRVCIWKVPFRYLSPFLFFLSSLPTFLQTSIRSIWIPFPNLSSLLLF